MVSIESEVFDACDSVTKIKKFCTERQQSGFRDLGIGSIVVCDCGDRYVLIEDQDLGRRWVPVIEQEGY